MTYQYSGDPKKQSKIKKAELIDRSFQVFARKMPDPKCELFYLSSYQLLVSVVLSAQATDKSVNKCMEPVYRQGFTPHSAVSLGASGILAIIKSIGLAPTKSKNVFALSKILIENFAGEVPDSREDLENLPGVGRKTANVILGELFDHPTLAVDTHVYRVSWRLGLHQEKTALLAEKKLLDLVDSRYLPKAHHWFILHGRYVCKASKPQCEFCELAEFCPSASLVDG